MRILGRNLRPSITAQQNKTVPSLLRCSPRVSLQGDEPHKIVWKAILHQIFWYKLEVYRYRLQINFQLSKTEEQTKVWYAQYYLTELKADSNFLNNIIHCNDCSS